MGEPFESWHQLTSITSMLEGMSMDDLGDPPFNYFMFWIFNFTSLHTDSTLHDECFRFLVRVYVRTMLKNRYNLVLSNAAGCKEGAPTQTELRTASKYSDKNNSESLKACSPTAGYILLLKTTMMMHCRKPGK